jgi:hypothetical protein
MKTKKIIENGNGNRMETERKRNGNRMEMEGEQNGNVIGMK